VILPGLAGVIERRLLVNYRVDPQAAARLLPAPFRPQMVGDFAVAGICLIRLEQMRPSRTPRWVGLGSENAAHRIAVEWDTPTGTRTGVYVPRRDSDSTVNVALGGTVYPGRHHRADFTIDDTTDRLRIAFTSRDQTTHVDVTVAPTEEFKSSRLFTNLATASSFFREGRVGYSATTTPGRFDGLQLETTAWAVTPVEVLDAQSSLFTDTTAFPAGTAELDNALLMRHVPVTWRPLTPLTVDNDPAQASA
jgi:hypothetical protein